MKSTFELSGYISDFPLPEVIQFLGMTSKHGELYVNTGNPDESGSVFFRDNTILHAQTDLDTGIDAFNQILSWQKGRFNFITEKSPEKSTINRPANYLLLDSQRVADEIFAIDASLPSSETVLFLNHVVAEIPQISKAEWKVICKVNGRRSLAGIVKKFRDPLKIKKIIYALIKKKLVAVEEQSEQWRKVILRLNKNFTVERPYPPLLRTNLLLKSIDGDKPLSELYAVLKVSKAELLEDVKLLIKTNWVTVGSKEADKEFIRYEES